MVAKSSRRLLLSRREAAEVLGVCTATVKRLQQTKKLREKRLGDGPTAKSFVLAEDVEALIGARIDDG